MNPKTVDFRCLHRLRVRWAEVDMQKIVFNAHYLMYFDTAMADYWRELALPYEVAMHQLGGDLYVKKASVEYFASARYDDRLAVGLRCGHIGNTSITFEGAIFRGDTLLVTGQLVYVFANPSTQTSRPVPDALRDLLMAYESGQSVMTVETAPWSGARGRTTPLRQAVLVQELGWDTSRVWDAADASAVHATVTNRLGAVVACGRLVQQAPGTARIDCMAVDPVLRGSGLGRQVLQALVACARSRGDTEVLLHTPRNAEGFFCKLGFMARGESLDATGQAPIDMVLAL